MNKSDIRKVISESILADGMSPVIDLKKSHGSWLVDKVTGKEYLDLFSMFANIENKSKYSFPVTLSTNHDPCDFFRSITGDIPSANILSLITFLISDLFIQLVFLSFRILEWPES